MPYIVDKVIVSSGALAVASITVLIPASAQEHDLLFAVVSTAESPPIISASEEFWWPGDRAGVWGQKTNFGVKWLQDGAAVPNSVTFTFSSTASCICTILLIRGSYDIHTFFKQNSTNDTSSFLDSSSLTTTKKNCLIVHAVSFDGAAMLTAADHNAAVCLVKMYNGSICQYVQFSNAYDAGLTRNLRMLSAVSDEGGTSWVVAIADADPENARMTAIAEHNYDIVKRYGGVTTAATNTQAFIRHDNITWLTSVSDFAATAIDGYVLFQNPLFAQVSVSNTASPWGNITRLTMLSDGYTWARDVWQGAAHTIAEMDFSDKLFSIEFVPVSLYSASNSGTGIRGFILYFEDANHNWAAYRITDSTGVAASALYVLFLDFEQQSPLDSSGGMDWSRVVKMGFLAHKNPTQTASIFGIKNALLHSPTVVTGGTAEQPFTPYMTGLFTSGHGAVGRSSVQGRGQVLLKYGLQIGNGTHKTVADFSAMSVEFPPSYDSSIENRFWNVGPLHPACKISILASPEDDIRLTSCVLSTQTMQRFEIDSASALDAFYDFAGASVTGWMVTWKTGVPCVRVAFGQCDEIDGKGATFSACTVADSVGVHALALDAGGSCEGSTFIQGADTYALNLREPGAYDLTGATFTGYDTPVHVTATSGTVQLLLPFGQEAPAYVSEGAEVVIVRPPVLAEVVISGVEPGSLVQIYDTGNSEELFCGYGPDYAWSETYTQDRTIRVRIAYCSAMTAKIFVDATIGTITEESPRIPYLANQEDDAVYVTNGRDGSEETGISIDDLHMLVNVDGNTLPWSALYAYETWWLSTADGIRDEGRVIVAIDPANYLFYWFQIKNTGVAPLVMTGGYARDAATGTAIALIDTSGGTIFMAPDHVVAYATGAEATVGIVQAGLTAQGVTPQRASILDNLDAAISTRATPEDIPDAPNMPTDEESIAFVQAGLTAQGVTIARMAKLDALDANVSSRATPSDIPTQPDVPTAAENAAAVWSYER